MLGYEAYKINMVDYITPNNREEFLTNSLNIATEYAQDQNFTDYISQKLEKRYMDERIKPLEAYREEELKQMKMNMFHNNLGFHEKRKQFVLKISAEKTPENIAIHYQKLNNIIDGKSIADEILEEVKEKVENLKSSIGLVPHLAIIRIGENPASISYIKQKRKSCAKVGINVTEFVLSERDDEHNIFGLIKNLNDNPMINGILIQLPIPAKFYSMREILELVNPEKDIDGFHAKNFGGKLCFIARFKKVG